MQERTDRKVFSPIKNPNDVRKIAFTAHSSKTSLAAVLVPEKRSLFFKACAIIEKSYTERCAHGVPCLPGGCAMSEGECCWEAMAKAEPEFSERIYQAWLVYANDPQNWVPGWKK